MATGGKVITWVKTISGTSTTYSMGTTINPNLPLDLTSRLHITGNQTVGQYDLSIDDVRKSDEGTYQCVLSGTSDGATTLILTVISKYIVFFLL